MAMLKSLTLTLLLALQVMAALTEAPIPGYDVVDLSWEIEVFPGRFENMTGTVENVYQAAKAMNPDWEPDIGPDSAYAADVAAVTAEPDTKNLTKRFDWSTAFCGPGTLRWHPCKVSKVQKGISYLRRQLGGPRLGPGPGTCGRVSCSWDASIWWCNDAPWATVVRSWIDIAESAQLIVWKCATGGGYSDKYVTGQIFSKRKWNVIVRHDRC